MTKHAADGRWFTLGLFLAACAFAWLTFGLSRTARLVPLFAVGFTLCLLSAQLIRELAARDTPLGDAQADRTCAAREQRAVAWVVGLGVLVYLCGLSAAAAMFTLLFSRVEARRSWLFSALMAAAISILPFALSAGLLSIHLPSGRLWKWLGW